MEIDGLGRLASANPLGEPGHNKRPAFRSIFEHYVDKGLKLPCLGQESGTADYALPFQPFPQIVVGCILANYGAGTANDILAVLNLHLGLLRGPSPKTCEKTRVNFSRVYHAAAERHHWLPLYVLLPALDLCTAAIR